MTNRDEPLHARTALAGSPVAVALLVAGLLAGSLSGCGGSAEERQEDLRQEIHAFLLEYLPKLGEAYSLGDADVLEGLAAGKELSAVDKRIRDILAQGRILHPTFRELTVEEVNDWNWANAFVTTVEVWDLRVYASGFEDGEPISEELGERQRVRYQLKREGDRWLVLFRTIQE